VCLALSKQHFKVQMLQLEVDASMLHLASLDLRQEEEITVRNIGFRTSITTEHSAASDGYSR
jgi:hypothetical protein